MRPLSEVQKASLQALFCSLTALAFRLHLSSSYFGWEEGDYGNVMMIREVADSGFTWFRTSHMPGWYSLAALVEPLVGSPRSAGLVLTVGTSCLCVGVATLLGRFLFGSGAAWLIGLWLAGQAEMALYGASTLRSPVFAAVGFCGMAALIWGHRRVGFGATALAFLIRMEGFFTLFLPALWTGLWDRGQRLSARGILVPVSLLAGVVLAWQAYITMVHGEGFFVLGPLGINLAGDLEGEGIEVGPWMAAGGGIIWDLLSWTLPRKLSWTWLLLALLGTWTLVRSEHRPGARGVVLYAAFGLAFWLGEGLLAQHHVNPEAAQLPPCGILDPEHNLYWVWLLHSIPFLAMLAGAGWASLERRLRHLPKALSSGLLVLVVASAFPSFDNEISLQMERSERWYRPQLDLSTWLETATPAGTGIVTSSIPEVWLKRQALTPDPTCDPDGDGRVYCWRRTDSGQRIFSWWTLPTTRGEMVPDSVTPHSAEAEEFPSEDDFVSFLAAEQISYVIFFEEMWTDSRRFASFLEEGGDVTRGGLRFTVLDKDPPMAECGYGWSLFGVHPEGSPPPASPPRYGQGVTGPGWSGDSP